MLDIKLPRLARLVAACWQRGEATTADLVAQKYPRPDEPFLTSLFAGELGVAIDEASGTGHVETAFLDDVRNAVPELDRIAESGLQGLVARVSFHGQGHEGRRSGSDIGIVIRRPLVHFATSGERLELHPDHASGFLAQAKLGRVLALPAPS
jgi:hypothetical protein